MTKKPIKNITWRLSDDYLCGRASSDMWFKTHIFAFIFYKFQSLSDIKYFLQNKLYKKKKSSHGIVFSFLHVEMCLVTLCDMSHKKMQSSITWKIPSIDKRARKKHNIRCCFSSKNRTEQIIFFLSFSLSRFLTLCVYDARKIGFILGVDWKYDVNILR